MILQDRRDLGMAYRDIDYFLYAIFLYAFLFAFLKAVTTHKL